MVYDIRNYDAVGDGKTINTHPVQSAIDACSLAGGGTVLVSGGRYVTGTLCLKDGVTLEIAGGSALVGSPSIADYARDTHKNMYKCEPHMDRCLLFARGARHIGICGDGEIDGQGACFPNHGDSGDNRPMLMRLLECEGIRMRDVTLRNPVAWTSAWLYCSDIVVDGVTIHSRANGNGDGLDFDGCRNVRVSNCSFDTSDDSICLQTSRPDRPCRDIMISNCVMCSYWGGVRIGLLSRSTIDNVTLTNCVFTDIRDAGIKIEMCEGGVIRNLAFNNLVMSNVPRPVFIALCRQRACVDAPETPPPIGAIRNISFDHIVVDNTTCGKNTAFFISGLPGCDLEDVRFGNIRMIASGGGTAEHGAQRDVLEFDDATLGGWWPGIHILEGRNGVLPCHGFYARHVRGLILNRAGFTSVAADVRPAVILDDVRQARLTSIEADPAAGAEAAIRLRNVQDIWLQDCLPPHSGVRLLQVEGKATAEVRLNGHSIDSGATA